ncbi:DNA mismatch repair protein MutS [Lacipirellula parvula]|uniref:DNA mismatch repair protein MutS n=1 Tax=Lacipirellula parvula TaxID=2650471 RepID=A0A5K7X4N6_9BACT|nr:DNA mismatch repair protein MutS [Lacipirellula parvula]BBO31355.1 DNA mismatch repair protein MutS [Lacipirellula parvula]
MALSPMMQQYHDAKQVAGDAILLFRMGDFYELFHEDAKTCARELGLSLTSRDKGENPIPMAGFPHHQLDQYLAKLIARGFRAAVCEQMEDPKQAKGIVKREVARIVSRGTVTDDSLLEPSTANFLLALAASPTKDACGLAWVDVSTGRFEATVTTAERLGDELARVAPVEILVREDAGELPGEWCEGRMITRRPTWAFSREAGDDALTRHFGAHSLDGFGFTDDDGPAIQAAGAVLDYLNETQKTSLGHIDRLIPYRRETRLEIDQATRRSLEISQTIRDGRREGSLLGVMDRTVTSMGARLLGEWLAAPLTDVAAIDSRLDAVGELHADPSFTGDLREALRSIYDIERLLARVTTGRATPRDLSFVARTLRCLPVVKAKLTGRKSARLSQLEERIDLCGDVREKLETALADDCPLNARDGGFVRPGFHAELDEQRELSKGGKQWIAAYQAEAIERTGIASMKVGFNNVFGYYLEITHAHRDKIPADFIRKQTLKNAERYVTPELKVHEEKVLAAEERAKDIEYDLFVELRETVAAAARRILATADALAEIDVLAGLAELARSRNYCRPTIVAEPRLELIAGRHPVLDATEAAGTFVPNDTSCEGRVASRELEPAGAELPPNNSHPATRHSILLITGPNMAGKSTYIRQTALLQLMAQVGSFVPAKSATVGVADRIFARVGASDDLARGRSTFMVEMTETARILNTATARSLVILDEIGRGTSTYDGLSLAWAVVEHLHDQIGCRTLFATHYHELTQLAKELPQLANFNVAVREWQDQVVFLHQIIPGAAEKSFGIHVAQLAGVPREVNQRAEQILASLEKGSAAASQNRAEDVELTRVDGSHAGANGVKRGRRRAGAQLQMTLFEAAEHPLLELIRGVDLDATSPRDAMKLIDHWQEQLLAEANGSA